MIVIKRNGKTEAANFGKIQARISPLAKNLAVDISTVSHDVIKNMGSKMHAASIDDLTSSICINMQLDHPDYEILARRVEISNWHKETPEKCTRVWNQIGVLGSKFRKFYKKYGEELHTMIEHERDDLFDYFSLKTMKQIYCLRSETGMVERPQHMFLRVACVVSGQYVHSDPDLDAVKKTYDALSMKTYTHGSPTLFNSGLDDKHMNLANCFLFTMDDSIDSIFATIGEMAQVSKCGGGLGLNLSSIRGKGAPISNGGKSDGLMPLLKMLDAKVRYINQSGRRKGALATFLEPWHPDFLDWLDIRKPGGNEEKRCRNLFCGVWMPDLFMKRVADDGLWTFMCPAKFPELPTTFGAEFETLYESIETSGDFVSQVRARNVWQRIISAQIESGVPYISYKDKVNETSNQKNLGVIKGSNLCNEIVEFTSSDNVAVCTLASISLPAFIDNGSFQYGKLADTAKLIVSNLNHVIDLNFYPIGTAKKSNNKNRPLGIGIQGFYDTCIDLGISFDSPESIELAGKIQAHIYYAAVEKSIELAQTHGAYDNFVGSDLSKGILHRDFFPGTDSYGLDWDSLRERAKNGVRNSLFIALMPTASTSLLFGNVESFEPIQSLCYIRKTMTGEFACIYSRFVRDLISIGLWTPEMRSRVLDAEGSIQNIAEIPEELRRKYVTAFDIKMKVYCDQAIARQPFVDQSMSFNVFFANPEIGKLSKLHQYCHKNGMKTSMYYLRSKPASAAKKITVNNVNAVGKSMTTVNQPNSDDDESVCLSCAA